MICPKCGKTIEDNAVYCEHCGEEIKIVPEFELDIDFAADILAREVLLSKEEENKELRSQIAKQKKKQILFQYSIIATVVFVLGIFIGLFFYTRCYTYQISKANAAIQNEQYEKAVIYLEKAANLRQEDISLLLDLGESYYRSDQIVKFVKTMENVISDSNSTTEHKIKAYSKLISHYSNTFNYPAIEVLISDCEVEEVLSLYGRYIASEPIFSYPEGTYESMVPLKLSSENEGCIYYATDGKMPYVGEEYLYTSPIYLEPGNHTISAFFVNEYGMKSSIITQNYHVELAVPNAPEISVESGEYTIPTLIEVLEFDDVEVYYTSDGTFPTQHSTIYEGSIPMPLGKSTFRFVGYNADGVAGEITEKTYNLILNTSYTTDTACYDVVKFMMEQGKISDTIGTSKGLNGWFKYQFLYPVTIEGYGDFYVIAELFQDITGNREKTGILYGVNIYDRTIYKLSKDKSGNYLLEGF